MVGFQRYYPYGDKKVFNNPSVGKYYNYRGSSDVAVWGLESWNLSNTLFLTEGVFDAARLTWHGMSALAVLSNDPDKSTTRWLWTVRKIRPVVAVCDNDKAGLKLAKYGTFSEIVEGHDLGDASEEYVKKLVEKWK